jgi:hypothetical protein
MSFDRARLVADAVLFEGYALYPYRPTAIKNQLRWQFGVLLPRPASETLGTDPWWLEAQVLVEGDAPRLSGRLRFLRARRRRVETLEGAPLRSIDVGGRLLVPWDEGEMCEQDFGIGSALDLQLAGDRTEEIVGDAARLVRTRGPISLRVETEFAGGRLRVRVENVGESAGARDDALLGATLGTHLLLQVEDGAFVSALDAPDCHSRGVYPILAGPPGARDLVLAAPIILPDHPQVAPESPGDLFDATEIDEILTLRTLLLTDEEKREARATDPRVAALIDRVDAMPASVLARLHGTMRAGARVRLRPGARRTDAQDMFIAGRIATVRERKHDVDGRVVLAVTIDDDPAADLHVWHGRYHYFHEDEVDPLD